MATGSRHSVLDLVEAAFSHAGLYWKDYVYTDQKFLRPAEVEHLIGDPSKAISKLGWRPSVDFNRLVEMMVDADMERVSREVKTQ